MELFRQAVTDENDIYIYFEVISRVNPSCILDFGMMLKRMGALSRQAMSRAIAQSVRLDGVDLYPDVLLPIYQVIYNQIYRMENLPDRKYDLGIVLCMEKRMDLTVIEYLCRHTSLILFDMDRKHFSDYVISRYPCQELKLEQRTFGLACCARPY